MSIKNKCDWLLAGCVFLAYFIQSSHAGNARFRSIEVPLEYGQLLVRSVVQNNEGFLLLGTDSGIYQYDGFKLSPYPMNTTEYESIGQVSASDLLSDSEGVLWVATRGSGLYRYDSGQLEHFSTTAEVKQKIRSDFISELLMDVDATLWLATEQGLHAIDADFQVSHFNYADADNDSWRFMTALLSVNTAELVIGTKAGLILFNRQTQTFKKLSLLPTEDSTVIYALHQDRDGGIWVGSDHGVFYRPWGEEEFTPFKPELISFKILSITSKDDDVWIGSISHGLFHYSLTKQSIEHFSYQRQQQDSLPDNTIVELFVDASGVLWVSTFYQGLNGLDIQSLHFGLENDSVGSVECAEGLLFSGFAEALTGDLWIANGTALIQYNQASRFCKRHAFRQGSHTIKSVLFDSQDQLWVATTLGLYQFDQQQEQFISKANNHEQWLTNFVVEQTPGHLLLGTIGGLYGYNISQDLLFSIKANHEPQNQLNVYAYTLSPHGEFYFATNAGVMKLINNQLFVAEGIQNQLASDEILNVYFDAAGRLWVGTDGQGVYVFDQHGVMVFHESYFGDGKQEGIRSIIQAFNGDMWMGSDSGLIQITADTFAFKVFYPADGVQGITFNINAAYRSEDGRLYLGGRNGFNAFYPQSIQPKSDPPAVVLTDFTRFGESVPILYRAKSMDMASEDFTLARPINELEELTLGHEDYVIGFEFAVLDFSDPIRNRYAFKMQGLDPNWTYVDADNRRISYSNLQPGSYEFQVKGANKHGVWNTAGKSLKVVVLPAPWLTWWAISTYVIASMLLLIWLVERKSQMNHRINIRLKSEVKKQTKALQAEKKTVEDLLAKKNQLFANVSHEFRTPLTLILGPVKRLLNAPLSSTHNQSLKMIDRNANRLLTMIEQLLQLAKLSGKHHVQYDTTEVHRVVEVLVGAFKVLAMDKHIDLQLIKNDQAKIRVTQHGLDVMLSNLLSNAIKYTPEGGRVMVASRLQGDVLNVSVKDTGAGLDASQKTHIFERFKRLDRDQNIAGIGIGLSVVKELADLNNASLEVESEPGFGSCFSLAFKTTDELITMPDRPSEILLVKQLTQPPEKHNLMTESMEWQENERKETVLIIDDNADMRNHLAETLTNHYQCLLADGGKAGISMAIKYVPDVVICDVMMPEVDGFHVSRVLRSDSRTSHIPLMLLTALDDKASRVRGWREHVDVYLTKPFDAKELLLQLENILVIRRILNKKAGASIHPGHEAGLIDLPKKDQEFITKLNQLIAENYKNPNFLRQQMASNMAVSERQLQRKLKALIDKNPIDLLREYRLSQAAVMLKDGYQVSITSEACGFNSLPHFSKCFKSQFGLSPKAYQFACK